MKKRIQPYLDEDVARMLEELFKKHGKRYGDITRIVNDALRQYISQIMGNNTDFRNMPTRTPTHTHTRAINPLEQRNEQYTNTMNQVIFSSNRTMNPTMQKLLTAVKEIISEFYASDIVRKDKIERIIAEKCGYDERTIRKYMNLLTHRYGVIKIVNGEYASLNRAGLVRFLNAVEMTNGYNPTISKIFEELEVMKHEGII